MKKNRKKRKSKSMLFTSTRVLKLKCRICKTIYNITTNKPEVYTKEVTKGWKCIFCNKKGGKSGR